MQNIIAVMFQFLKATKNENLPESLKLLCPPIVKWRLCQFLPVIVKMSFCLADTFQLHNTSDLFFLNVQNTRKEKRSSGKYRLNKYLLYNKRPAEHAILPPSFFSFLQH